jgi:hypothetical protein
MLLPRTKCQLNQEQNENIIHLFAINKQVDDHNTSCLESINQQGYVLYATYYMYTICSIGPTIKSKVLDISKDLPLQTTQNLQQSLQIKISGKYMITHNIDTEDGPTNEATCVVKSFKIVEGKPVVIWVKFEDKDTGELIKYDKQDQQGKAAFNED